jgi:hypothetical protein
MIVSGSQAYIEMVESVLSAYRANAQVEAVQARNAIPPPSK